MSPSKEKLSQAAYDEECRFMGLFIDNAKTYVQLSAGALLLTIAFVRDVLGVPKDQRIPADGLLIASWALFLLAVVIGASYQYLAIKYMEARSPLSPPMIPVPRGLRWAAASPGNIYGAMLVCFYLGGGLFTAAATRGLVR